MEASPVNRRLAAILAADIAGYSRLMAGDEEATLRTLGAYRAAISDLVAEHGGRIFGTAGDSVIVEFASAVNSVRAGVAIQRALERRNADLPKGRRMEFRIGINVGDVVAEGDDLLGDGVNVAARLQEVAEPAGICISGSVQEQIEGKLQFPLTPLGERSLKNIPRPVSVYRVDWDVDAPTTKSVLSGAPLLTLPDKPSIAVLPFQNMSGDAEQDYFADGMVEEIITALSRFKSFAVVARNSSFVYKGRAVDVRQVAKELGVRYVLEGSVRKSGNRLRITAQLVDGTSGAHLWADRFDGAVEDVFDVQDRITESVATIVEPQIREAEIERSRRERPGSVAAYDLYLQALPKIRAGTQDENAVAYSLLSKAIGLEPNNGILLASALEALQWRVGAGWPTITGDDKAAWRDLAPRALANAHGDAAVLVRCGHGLIKVSREYELGLATVRRAVEINPNNVDVLRLAGAGAIHGGGSLDDALAYFNRALRLSPADPYAFHVLTGIAHVQMILGQYAEALAFAERSLAVHASFEITYWMLIAANAQLGRMDDAQNWLARFRALVPGMTIARIKAGQAEKDGTRMTAILEGLRLAGLDEG